jgi:phospholipid transport system substrate-binding protein
MGGLRRLAGGGGDASPGNRHNAQEVIVKKWSALVLLLTLAIIPVHVLAGVPLDTVKANVSGVLDVLRDPKLKGEAGKKVKEQRIEAAADKLFDYVELSKRTLGLSWNKFSPEQRKEFVEIYRTILKNAYVDKITAYTNEQVNFTKETPLSEGTAEIHSVIVSKGGETPIYYRAMKKGNAWKVYDVVIEGVSLISNYRTQFREILGNNPPEKLLETLRKKVGKK